MAQQQEKPGLIERGANFFEKLHYGLGAAAIAGAAVFGRLFLHVCCKAQFLIEYAP